MLNSLLSGAGAALRRLLTGRAPVAMGILLAFGGAGANAAAVRSPTELKRMTLDELLGQEVLLVSRRPAPISRSASAVQVIQGDTIRRSGATRLPEALRLASNLQVAQIDAGRWAVSARGFNSVLANKLLVQIDGRSVYSPLFAGVFWASQDVLLEDIERIEVVSGPGGALWGANAVNGVINVRTKSARDTHGLLVKAGLGDGLRGVAAVRYGHQLSPDLHFRAYGKYTTRDGNVVPSGVERGDLRALQGGFRLDWDVSTDDVVTLQGDLYENRVSEPGARDRLRGGNLLGRWSRTLSADAGFEVQVFADRVVRELPTQYIDHLDTYDFDFQHHFRAADRHQIVWGGGYRLVEDDFQSGRIVMRPEHSSLETYSAFLQDTVSLLAQRLQLTLGTKLEHNDYTGLEVQPSARVAWIQSERQMWWGAVSRAIRTPSRLDRDRHIVPQLAGSPDFQSEELLAWEAGWRVQPHERWSWATAAFYHDYDNIRSIEFAPPGAPAPFVLGNGQQGRSYGVEVTADYQATAWWRIHAGVTEMRVRIEPTPASRDQSRGVLESVDSNRYLSLRSTWDLPGRVEVYAGLRYASRLTNRTSHTPGYTELDARIAWRPEPRWEIAIAGQNLLHDKHVEYGDPTMRHEVERTIYGTVRWEY